MFRHSYCAAVVKRRINLIECLFQQQKQNFCLVPKNCKRAPSRLLPTNKEPSNRAMKTKARRNSSIASKSLKATTTNTGDCTKSLLRRAIPFSFSRTSIRNVLPIIGNGAYLVSLFRRNEKIRAFIFTPCSLYIHIIYQQQFDMYFPLCV